MTEVQRTEFIAQLILQGISVQGLTLNLDDISSQSSVIGLKLNLSGISEVASVEKFTMMVGASLAKVLPTIIPLGSVNVMKAAEIIEHTEGINVAECFKAAFASMTEVQVKETLTALLQESAHNEILVANIVSAALAGSTTLSVPEIVALVVVNGTEFQIASVFKQFEADKTVAEVEAFLAKPLQSFTDVEIAKLYTVAAQEHCTVTVRAITELLLRDDMGLDRLAPILQKVEATRWKVRTDKEYSHKEAKHLKFIVRPDAGDKTIPLLSDVDYWERTPFKWTVFRIKAAQSAGNEKLVNELKERLTEEIIGWLNADEYNPDFYSDLEE